MAVIGCKPTSKHKNMKYQFGIAICPQMDYDGPFVKTAIVDKTNLNSHKYYLLL